MSEGARLSYDLGVSMATGVLCQTNRGVEGDVLEVGGWRGGTGGYWRRHDAERAIRKFYLADTFADVVKAAAMTPAIGVASTRILRAQ
jgi:hypothetical protein